MLPAHRSRIVFHCTILAGWLFAIPVLASEPPQIRVLLSDPVEAVAGEAVTSAFIIEQSGSNAERISFEVELPPGWRLAVQLTDVVLEPDRRVTRLLSIHVPGSATAGRYVVRVRIHAEHAPDAAVSELRVTVLPHYGISLDLLEAPRLAAASESFATRFLLTNTGNVADTVRVRARVDGSFSVTPGEIVISLSPREQREVEVVVRSTSPLLQTSLVMVHMVATALGDSERRDRATASVQIVPVGMPRQMGGGVPASLRMAAVGSGEDVAGQVEISSEGADVGWPLSFMLRLPQMGDNSLYRYQDFYQVRYETDRLSAIIGDHRLELSPLFSSGMQSFGSEVRATIDDLSVTGFLSQSRHAWTDQSEQALYLRYGDEMGWLGAGVLRAHGGYGGEAVSIRGVFAPDASSRFDLELSGGSDRAGRLHASGRYESLAYQVEWLSAGTDFPGTHRGQEQRAARLALYPLRSVAIEGRYSDFRQSLGSQRSARGVTSHRLSVRKDGRRFLRGSSVRIGYGQQARSFSGALDQDVSESTFDVGVAYSRRGLFTTAVIEAGAFTPNREIGIPVALRRLTLQASYGGETMSASAWLQAQAGPSISNPMVSSSWTAAVSGQVSLSSAVSTDADLTLAYHGGVRDVLMASSRVRVRLQLPTRGSLDFGVQYRRLDGFHHNQTFEYTLGYSLPFGIPRPAGSDGPRIRGRLIDQHGMPIPNVLVRAADAAVLTDQEGRFVLPASETEVRYLYIDRMTLGFERIPLVPMPLAVSPGAPADEITIVVAPSAELYGRVENRGASAVDIPRLVIEISDGESQVRVMTDRGGRFSFHDLRPGRWEVRIVDPRIGDHLILEEETFSVDLIAGSSGEVAFGFREKDRMVRIIQRGVIRSTDP